ncbi:cupin domain-containing protein [Eubacteriales bacterium OttesenSCG-928-N14]|nr:cupin domain-containing protein [Eubacteriales bacterium OttesenSCG-928-N14]
MSEQITAIAARLREMREIMDISTVEMAETLGIDLSTYEEYEEGKHDFSFSMLYGAANKLGVDIVDLLTGDRPKLTYFSLVKNGQGLDIERRKEYKYKHLAYFFKDKHAEPFLVTVEPGNGEVHLNTHEGQEFNYVLCGSMFIQVGEMKVVLEQGDAVYYDSSVPHGMKAEGEQACDFLSIIIK